MTDDDRARLELAKDVGDAIDVRQATSPLESPPNQRHLYREAKRRQYEEAWRRRQEADQYHDDRLHRVSRRLNFPDPA